MLSSGADFLGLDMVLTFNSTVSNVSCYTVEIVDDRAVENEEEFLLLLSSEDPAVLTTSNVSITIQDNDGELGISVYIIYQQSNCVLIFHRVVLQVSFQPDTEQFLSEGDQIEVCVVRSNDLERTIEVNIDANTGSGIAKLCHIVFLP